MNTDFSLITDNETTQNHGAYGAALFDPRWKSKRKEILERDRNMCVLCKSDKKLHVHHRQYHFSRTLNTFRNPWEYSPNLMITLCESCHQKGHRLYKVPTKYIK
jgi:5-methylcytosine-specific restriction endonuclease McrA